MVIFSGDQPHPSNTLRLTSGVMKRTLTKDQYELETYEQDEQDELNNLYKQDKQALLLLRYIHATTKSQNKLQ